MCRVADGAGCDRENKCAFNAVGSDGSSTEGILATENVIYSDQKFSNLMFGCVHGSSKGFGVFGLDMSKESFVNQYENLTRGRFSYCLPSLKNGDAITTVKFGDNANVLGDYTPIKVGKEGNAYNVNLLDISVGNERLNVKAGSFEMDQNGNGGTIIDAGTMISFLTQPVYDALVSKLNKTVQLAPSQPQQSQLSFCFKGTQKDLIAPKIPDLTFHFEGLNVTVPAFNVFVPVNEETVCLAILPSADVAVFGGVLQQGLNLGFDVKEMRAYMKSTDCGKV
ncbi:hypothetical protein LUZ60_012203 [Juncus effusus]|nr:hypothetical protein LUZ60_012203 [Juncus effusus]